MIVYYCAAVTASHRKEELNPSKSSKQAHKQIHGESKRKQQILVFVVTKECCFIAIVKAQR